MGFWDVFVDVVEVALAPVTGGASLGAGEAVDAVTGGKKEDKKPSPTGPSEAEMRAEQQKAEKETLNAAYAENYRRGRTSTILNRPSLLGSEAGVSRKTLLGG